MLQPGLTIGDKRAEVRDVGGNAVLLQKSRGTPERRQYE
jgi:hypothetical protein